MIKFVAAALWICAVTVGAVIYSYQSAGARTENPASGEAPAPKLDYVKMDIISVPVLRDAHIVGYFLTRLVYTIEPQKLAKVSIPIDALIVDQVYSYIFGNPDLDFTDKKAIDLDTYRKGVRDSINKRVGDTLVQEVLIEQIDYLSKEEIRDNTIRRKMQAGATAREMAKGFQEGTSAPKPH